jgi:hypothetical protein
MAGLSNEHTVPAFIVLFALAIATDQNKAIWKLSGWVGLTLGYIALFFAPGQNARYGPGKKTAGIDAAFTNFTDRLQGVSDAFIWGSNWPQVTMLACIVAICVLCLFALRIAKDRKLALGGAFPLVAAPLILATTAFSPFLVPRLLFASYILIAIGLTFFASRLLLQSPRSACVALLLAGLVATPYFVVCLHAYREHYVAFIAQGEQIKAKNGGTFTAYIAGIPDYSEFVHRDGFSESADDRLNRLRAIYYGVPSVQFK